MEFIPTNDCFHHLLRLKGIVRDKALIIDIFKAQGLTVSKARIESWDTKTGKPSSNYREMPRDALDAFIYELYKRKL